MVDTSNRAVGACASVFGDPIAATDTLDRLPHYSHLVRICGDGNRLPEKRRRRLLQKPAPTPLLSKT